MSFNVHLMSNLLGRVLACIPAKAQPEKQNHQEICACEHVSGGVTVVGIGYAVPIRLLPTGQTVRKEEGSCYRLTLSQQNPYIETPISNMIVLEGGPFEGD